FFLDNGLEVVVISNHRAPLGYLKLYYKAGSFYDPYSKGGIAHLLEHLMFRGTKKVKDKEFNKIMEENGVENNAYTTYLHTGYYEFSDISKLELLLALEADRMENLEISDDVFLTERDVVLEERMQRFETNVVTKFYDSLRKIFWEKHPYSRPVSGEIEEIKNLEKKDVFDFYERYYRPENALLVLAGDIKKDEAKSLVDKYFGKIKKAYRDISKLEVIEPQEGNFELKMELLGIEHNRFVSYWHIPKGMLNKKEEQALGFLSEFLCGDDTAYLYDKLVYREKKFLSIGVDGEYNNEYGGMLSLYGIPVDEKMKLEDFRELFEREIKNGVENMTEDDIAKIRNESLSNVNYLLENTKGLADFVGGMKLDGVSDEDIKGLDDIIKSVKLEDVKDVYKKILEVRGRIIYGQLDKKKD
ncbi:MAG: insulinase family protein, partial [Alphaproteobacteria bacterium]|nr:insulinase family protein [Alphaproteobacteria bacterium]